jgi:hypothetical protein
LFDPIGDMFLVEYPAWSDIVYAKAEYVGGDTCRFEIRMAAAIPADPDTNFGFVWGLDLDRIDSEPIGYGTNDIETELHVRIGYDNSTKSYYGTLDYIDPSVTGQLLSFEVVTDGAKALVVIDGFGASGGFDWEAGIPWTPGATDIVPNSGHGTLLPTFYRTTIVPDTLWSYQMNSITPLPVEIFVGSTSAEQSTLKWDSASFMINGAVVPDAIMMIDTVPDFSGPVWKLTASAPELISTYPLWFDTTLQHYVVTGSDTLGEVLLVDGTFAAVGHRSGDVNSDGNVNVVDVTYLVAYLFQGGSPPPVMEAADVNGDDRVNITDLTYLVDYLFRGGPGPLHG